jgi:probable rRNA maturation factor
MAISVDLQNDEELDLVPSEQQFEQWIAVALQESYPRLEQTIRIVGEAESRELNSRYRGKASATNVLAFPGANELLDYDCLGDLVICAPVVAVEAEAQERRVEAHWAHLVVHGMLHLQGFDHKTDADTRQMETLEIKILDSLGVANPYNV